MPLNDRSRKKNENKRMEWWKENEKGHIICVAKENFPFAFI